MLILLTPFIPQSNNCQFRPGFSLSLSCVKVKPARESFQSVGQLNVLWGDTNFPRPVYTSSQTPGCWSNWQGREEYHPSQTAGPIMLTRTPDHGLWILLKEPPYANSCLLIHIICLLISENKKESNLWKHRKLWSNQVL